MITESIRDFGSRQAVPHLAEVVLDLYDAALKESSRRTYGTGQRAYARFVHGLAHGVRYPFRQQNLSQTELNLAFFMPFLLLEPHISSANTILGYESHVKYNFREEGCEEYEYTTPFLKQVRRGVRNTLPEKADKRGALLLPLLTLTRDSFQTRTDDINCLLHFTVVIGFLGMLRPHTFAQLRPSSLSIVTYKGTCINMPGNKEIFRSCLKEVRRGEGVLGFYVDFQSKTMRNARAYFPSLSSRSSNTNIVAICPVRALIAIVNRGLVKGYFLRPVTKGKHLPKYLQQLAGSESPVAAYTLRIGGRTWKLTNGMDRQMVDYLGTWKSPEASARYFRGNPHSVLQLVRTFYLKSDPHIKNLRKGDHVARGSHG